MMNIDSNKTNTKSNLYVLIAGPALAILVGVLSFFSQLPQPIAYTLAITSWVALWWVFEPVPIPVTSLLPFVLFPAAGVLTHKQAAMGLGSHVILLLMGGFMLAKGIENSGLHKRLAMSLLKLTGSRSGRPLVFAFMASGALLSMWISNTASCLVLLPIALAVLNQLEDDGLAVPLILGVAFSCNIGGIATLIGTPPNLVFAGVYESYTGEEFSFFAWLKLGLPIVILGLPLTALWLTRGLKKGQKVDLPSLGQWCSHERRALAVFSLVILLWVFRLEPFGGYSAFLGLQNVGDSTVALLGVVLMCVIPAQKKSAKPILTWQQAADIPWGMLMLFAGGIVLAKAFQESGTAQMLGEALQGIEGLPPYLLIFGICLSITFLTELTSNVATTTLFMPVMAAAATAASLPLEVMMLPAAMSASCAFMLPVATAPNVIAFGTGRVTIRRMMSEGLVLNLMMAVIIASVLYLSLF